MSQTSPTPETATAPSGKARAARIDLDAVRGPARTDTASFDVSYISPRPPRRKRRVSTDTRWLVVAIAVIVLLDVMARELNGIYL